MVQEFSEKSLRGLSAHEGLSYRGGQSGRGIEDWDDEVDIKEVPMRKWPLGALRKSTSFKTSKAADDLMDPYKNESSHRSSLDDPWGSSHHHIDEISEVDTKSISVFESDFFDDESRDLEEGGFRDEPSKEQIKKKGIPEKDGDGTRKWFGRRYRKYWMIIGGTALLVVLSSLIGTLVSKDSSSSTIEKPASSSLLEDASSSTSPTGNTVMDQNGNTATSISPASSTVNESIDATTLQSVSSSATADTSSSSNAPTTTKATLVGGSTPNLPGSTMTSDTSVSTGLTTFLPNPQEATQSPESATNPVTSSDSQTSFVSSPSSSFTNEGSSTVLVAQSTSTLTQSTLAESIATASVSSQSVSSQATENQPTSAASMTSSSIGDVVTSNVIPPTESTQEQPQQPNTQTGTIPAVSTTTQATGPIAPFKLEIRVDEFAGDISSQVILHSTGDIIKSFAPDPSLEKYQKDETDLDLMQGQIYRLCAEDKGYNGIWRNGFLSIKTTSALPQELVHIDGDDFTSHICKCFQVPVVGEEPTPSFTCPGHYIEIKRDNFPLEIKAEVLDFNTNTVVATMNPSAHAQAAEIERQLIGQLKKGHSYKLCGKDQAGDGIAGGYIKLIQVQGLKSIEKEAVYIGGNFQQESCLCFTTPLDGEAIPAAHECPGFFVEIEKDDFCGSSRATITERSTGVDIMKFTRSWDNEPSRSQNVPLQIGQDYELCTSSQYPGEGGYVGIVEVQGAQEDFVVKIDASNHNFSEDSICYCFSVSGNGATDQNAAFVCSPTESTTESTTSTSTTTTTRTTTIALSSTLPATTLVSSESVSSIVTSTQDMPETTTAVQTVSTTTTTSSTTTEFTGPTAPFVLEIQVDENAEEISSEVVLQATGSVVATFSPDASLGELEKATTDLNLIMGQVYRLCAEDSNRNGIWRGGYLSIKSNTNPIQELVHIAGNSYMTGTCRCFMVPEEGEAAIPDFACPGHYIEIKRDNFPLEIKAELTDIATNEIVDSMHPSISPNSLEVERQLTTQLHENHEYKLCAYDQAGDGINGGYIKLIQIADIGSPEKQAVYIDGSSFTSSSCLCFTVPKHGEALTPAHECAGFAIEIEKDEFRDLATGTVTDHTTGQEVAHFSRSGDNSPERSKQLSLQSEHEYRFCISSEDPKEGGYAGVYQSSPDGNQGFLVKISGTEHNFAAAPVCACFTTPTVGGTPDPNAAYPC